MAIKQKYYYQVRKSGRGIWESPIRGFFSYPGGVWSYIIRTKKKYKKFEKRIVIKVDNIESEIINITNEDIEFYIKSQHDKHKLKEENLYGNSIYHYFFEVKTEITKGNVTVIQWENPVNAFFPDAFCVWNYIIRNRDKFQSQEKRLRAVDKESGQDIFINDVDETLINNMSAKNLFGRTI